MLDFNATDYHSNSWSFIGADCSIIKDWVLDCVKGKNLDFSSAYIDAFHGDKGSLHSGLNTEVLMYEVKGEMDTSSKLNPLALRTAFNAQDCLLVNGNHYHAANQIVFIQEKKYKSLKKKVGRLNNVKAIVFLDQEELHDYLPEVLKKNIPTFKRDEIDAFAKWFAQQYQAPELYGLVLNGGKSSRMGSPKGEMKIHGEAMWRFAYHQLSEFTEQTFLSVKNGLDTLDVPVIKDQFLEMGVLGALLTAFQHHPNKAFLIVANDNPALSKKTLEQLVACREPKAGATCAVNTSSNRKEPLYAIWEPKSRIALMNALFSGNYKLSEVLENLEVNEVAVDDKYLANINTPEDLKDYKSQQS